MIKRFGFMCLCVVSMLEAGSVFRTAVKAPLQTLDHAYASSSSELFVVEQLFDPLLRVNQETNNIEPFSAQSFDLSIDGKTLKFLLKPNQKFSTGTVITASHYIDQWIRVLKSFPVSPHQSKLFIIQGAQSFSQGTIIDPRELGMKALSNNEIEVTFKYPNSQSLLLFTQSFTAPVELKKMDQSLESQLTIDHFSCNGPFLPVRQNDKVLLLRKNPHHGGKVKNIDEVTVYLISIVQEAMDLFAKEEIHYFGLHDFHADVPSMVTTLNRGKIFFQKALRTQFMRVNPNIVSLSLKEFRQALAMALNRRLIIESLGVNGQTQAFSIMPSGIFNYNPPKGFLYSPSKAKRSLEMLGYCMGKVSPNCKSLDPLELLVLDQKENVKLGYAIESVYKNNLMMNKLKIKAVSRMEFEQRIQSGQYQLALDEVIGGVEYPFDVFEHFLPDGVESALQVHPNYEKMIQNALSSPTLDRAMLFYRQAESILMDDVQVIPVIHGAVTILLSSKIKNFKRLAWGYQRINEIEFKTL